MISRVLYAVCCVLLAIYSYGYLDYNLTLSSHPLFLKFVDPLQDLVYFDRPLSARAYVGILLGMFAVFAGLLGYWNKRKPKTFPWKLFLVLALFLSFSYPMLSYDVYNYMFHAKILWFYHANPHMHAPLEFQNDLWLRFMRWVHTPSAYGPVFTVIESPAYLLGFGKFVPALYLMKLTMTGFFAWCVYLIGKLGQELKMSHERIVLAQYFVAFNPFLLLELVINAHNDAVMIAFMLLSILYSLQSKHGFSVISLALSAGIKYVTALVAPVLLIKKQKLKILLMTAVLLGPVLGSPGRFQPWYLTWALIPAILIDHVAVRVWIVLASIAGLIYYIPYIATGFWNNSLPFVSLVLYVPLLVSSITFITYHPQGAK